MLLSGNAMQQRVNNYFDAHDIEILCVFKVENTLYVLTRLDNLTIYCYCNYPLNLTTLFAYSHTTVISIICTYTFPLKYRGKYRYFFNEQITIR